MTKNLVTLSPKDNLSQVSEVFKTHSIHHIPVTEYTKIVGMVSKSDYLQYCKGWDARETHYRMAEAKVEDIMVKGLAKMEATDKINVALEIFKENLFHAIPIVEDEKLVGIVTTYDIIAQLADSNSELNKYE